MKIYGKQNIRIITFEDLEKGDVFYFSSDNDKDEKRVYMRCGHTSELVAVNLETGICYSFDANQAVVKLDGEFHINGIIK